jgi:hypothetical protein
MLDISYLARALQQRRSTRCSVVTEVAYVNGANTARQQGANIIFHKPDGKVSRWRGGGEGREGKSF